MSMLYIFDWDGTLMDSTGKIVRCIQAAIADLRLPSRTDSEAKSIIGLGLPEVVATLFPGISDTDSTLFRKRYSQYFIEADQVPCHFYPGVERVLEQLRADGHSLAVATGKSRKGLTRVLGNVGMQNYFHATRCADETASKPNPLMLEQLLEELGCEADQALMVGDTQFDLIMAQNAGIRSVGVSYGAHSEERLLACQPLRLIDHFEQLLE